MTDRETTHRIGLIQIHLAVLLAGGAGLFAKAVPVGPEVLTAGRTVFGSLALLIFAAATRTSLRIRSPRDLLALLLAGAILAAHWVTFFHAIQVSTVAIGLLAFSTFPLFTTVLEPVLFREPLRRAAIVTALMVSAGLVLVTPSFDVGNHLTRGLLWGILSALLFALLSLLGRSYNRRYSPIAIAFYQQAGAALCTLPFALAWDGTLSGRDWAYLVLLGVVFTAVGQGLVLGSLRYLRAQTVSVVFGLEPVYGILLAWLLMREVPTLRIAGGGALICGAVLWASLTREAAPPQA